MINCKGKLIDLTSPKIMGILNCTPDSFFDGGKYKTDKHILEQVGEMLESGASFIDVGSYSSRPNADFVSEDTELQRIIPVINLILKEFPEVLISVDTFRSKVARESVISGAAIINDISAGKLDEKMLKTAGELSVPYIMMHMLGTPKTMQQYTDYEDLIKEILFYFSERIYQARSFGIKDIIIDPGFGFAKTLNQNYELLQKLDLLQIAALPVLVGVSRKSMIYNLFQTTPQEALNGTTAVNMLALTKGAKILRVHDVKEAAECIKIYNEFSR